MAQLINGAQAAEFLGVSRQAIARAVAAGRIHYADPKAKLFDRAALEAAWAGNRRRRRAPKAKDGAAAVPATADDSVAGLARRKLAAETVILEHRARVGSGARIPQAAMERAFVNFYQLGRAAVDNLHPRIMEAVAGTSVGDHTPAYMEVYTATFIAARHVWIDVWMELALAVIHERPEFRTWFEAFAAASRGRPADDDAAGGNGEDRGDA